MVGVDSGVFFSVFVTVGKRRRAARGCTTPGLWVCIAWCPYRWVVVKDRGKVAVHGVYTCHQTIVGLEAVHDRSGFRCVRLVKRIVLGEAWVERHSPYHRFERIVSEVGPCVIGQIPVCRIRGGFFLVGIVTVQCGSGWWRDDLNIDGRWPLTA